MSLETAANVARREHDRQQEFVDALEARHGEDVAWVLRHHAEMLYLVASTSPPEDYFTDARVAAVVETGQEQLVSLILESLNVVLKQFIFKRPLTKAEAKTYSDELYFIVEALVASEIALLAEYQKP